MGNSSSEGTSPVGSPPQGSLVGNDVEEMEEETEEEERGKWVVKNTSSNNDNNNRAAVQLQQQQQREKGTTDKDFSACFTLPSTLGTIGRNAGRGRVTNLERGRGRGSGVFNN